MRTTLLLGLGAALAFSVPAAAQNCGSGQTTAAPFVGGNGQAGNMFDIAVGAVDMTIECVDINHGTAGQLLDVEVWYCPTTAVGNGTNAAVWTLVGSATGVTSAGNNLATNVDISGNGVVFSAGQTYGIFVQIANYPSVSSMRYTNGGPNTYFGTHCDITTQYGSAVNWGGTFFPREWNGVMYTELAGPAGPSIAVSAGAPGGSMTFDFAGYTAASPIAVLYGPAGSYTAAGGPCAGTTVDLSPINITSPIIVLSDANGDAQLTQNVPAAGAGLTVQAADVATCGPSNTIVL